ncbi:hypothetical protein F7D09_0923 [Bifidobacterium leontopitheci]|uniref:DNA primase/polymerase bifunctional N-terminal domain-containing protein n=2 Tax=Bifidobacterium leontopitheci TaxID=2650774 RepID=A0A6I1GFZ1_9BIFI|nr:hypothetical protein F7D09_0923 [Bifidobacterium leontopitheci]
MAAHRLRKAVDYPLEMRLTVRWCRWAKTMRGGSATKRPIMANGSPASTSDPTTWDCLGSVEASRAGDGTGFMLGDGFACIDLDHCYDNRHHLTPWAKMLIAPVAGTAYIEISPSGDGLHIWGRMDERPGLKIRNELGMNIEAYSVGRYMTVTGRRHPSSGRQLPDLAFLWNVIERLR